MQKASQDARNATAPSGCGWEPQWPASMHPKWCHPITLHSSCKCCLMLCTGLDQYTCKDVLSLAQCRMPGLSDHPLQDWTSIHQGAVQEAFQFLSERFHVAPWSQEDTQQLHQRALLVAQAWCCPAHTPCLHASPGQRQPAVSAPAGTDQQRLVLPLFFPVCLGRSGKLSRKALAPGVS